MKLWNNSTMRCHKSENQLTRMYFLIKKFRISRKSSTLAWFFINREMYN